MSFFVKKGHHIVESLGYDYPIKTNHFPVRAKYGFSDVARTV